MIMQKEQEALYEKHNEIAEEDVAEKAERERYLRKKC
jgi:hypothetical protein